MNESVVPAIGKQKNRLEAELGILGNRKRTEPILVRLTKSELLEVQSQLTNVIRFVNGHLACVRVILAKEEKIKGDRFDKLSLIGNHRLKMEALH